MFITPHVLMDSTVVAYLNIDDLDIPQKENLQHLLQFQIGTYVKLTKVKSMYEPGAHEEKPIRDDNWDVIYANVNQFLNGLSKEHQISLAQGFMLMHNTITEYFRTAKDLMNLNAAMRQVGEQLDEVDKSIDLLGQLRTYVDNHMVVGIYEGAGKRAQDSDKLTFQPDQVTTLMSVTILCKLLSPIYGEIMANLDKKIDTKLKELHAVSILTQMYQRRFPELIDKLMYYIRHTVNQHNEETTSGLMHGYDNTSMTYHMYSVLMTRQFVNVDLRVRNGNLMTYIIVSIKRAINTVKSAIKKNPTFSRKPVTAKHEEDGNTAQLEIDAMTSKKTLDVGPIISAAIDPTIRMLMAKYQIDDESYQASLEYYLKNPIVPNPINCDINAIFFSKHLGGGNGLRMLRGPEYTKITTLMQLIVFSLDSNYQELGHVMTARMADTAVDTTINANMFSVKVGGSTHYRTVKQLFENNPYGIRGKDWDNHVKKLTDILTTNKYLYNTSNFLWNWLDQDNTNGKIFAPSDATITAMCSLYDFYMANEEI